MGGVAWREGGGGCGPLCPPPRESKKASKSVLSSSGQNSDES